MTPNSYTILERAIEEGLTAYLLNRVNKHSYRILWCKQETIDGPTMVIVDINEQDRAIREIADEAVDYLMNSVCDVFFFEEEPLAESNALRYGAKTIFQPVPQDPVQEWSAWRSAKIEVAKDKLRRFVRRLFGRSL